MIARISFGGSLDTQLWVGVVAIAVMSSTVLAWVNIKRLQIDQHRKWMLRVWFYVCHYHLLHFSHLQPARLTNKPPFDSMMASTG